MANSGSFERGTGYLSLVALAGIESQSLRSPPLRSIPALSDCLNRLKCNRTHPCENCIKRGDPSSCTYAQGAARKKNSPTQSSSNSPDDMQNRIDRLENLVLSLMTNGSQSAGPAAAMAAVSGDSSTGSAQYTSDLEIDENGPVGAEESDTEQVTKSFGILKVDNNKSYYISDAHWASVLHEVCLPNHFQLAPVNVRP